MFRQVDILRKAYIKPPHITMLAQKLQEYGMPGDVLTVEEALDHFKKLIKRA